MLFIAIFLPILIQAQQLRNHSLFCSSGDGDKNEMEKGSHLVYNWSYTDDVFVGGDMTGSRIVECDRGCALSPLSMVPRCLPFKNSLIPTHVGDERRHRKEVELWGELDDDGSVKSYHDFNKKCSAKPVVGVNLTKDAPDVGSFVEMSHFYMVEDAQYDASRTPTTFKDGIVQGIELEMSRWQTCFIGDRPVSCKEVNLSCKLTSVTLALRPVKHEPPSAVSSNLAYLEDDDEIDFPEASSNVTLGSEFELLYNFPADHNLSGVLSERLEEFRVFVHVIVRSDGDASEDSSIQCNIGCSQLNVFWISEEVDNSPEVLVSRDVDWASYAYPLDSVQVNHPDSNIPLRRDDPSLWKEPEMRPDRAVSWTHVTELPDEHTDKSSVYYRRQFSVRPDAKLECVSWLQFLANAADGWVVWMNGEAVWWQNVHPHLEELFAGRLAELKPELGPAGAVVGTRTDVPFLVNGLNTIAVEVHSASPGFIRTLSFSLEVRAHVNSSCYVGPLLNETQPEVEGQFAPTETPSPPTMAPTTSPTTSPTVQPTYEPTVQPTAMPSPFPTPLPTAMASPTPSPTPDSADTMTDTSTDEPTDTTTDEPTDVTTGAPADMDETQQTPSPTTASRTISPLPPTPSTTAPSVLPANLQWNDATLAVGAGVLVMGMICFWKRRSGGGGRAVADRGGGMRDVGYEELGFEPRGGGGDDGGYQVSGGGGSVAMMSLSGGASSGGSHEVEENIVVRKGKSLQLGGAMPARMGGAATAPRSTGAAGTSSAGEEARTVASARAPSPANQDAAIDGILSGLTPAFAPAPLVEQQLPPSTRLAADVPDDLGEGSGGWASTTAGEHLDPGDFGWSDDDDF
uniref:Uncharacterized protein n=1 Tax=Sexangularia sp. CB-2014 TaxID=1486929 RepID=A0A7S1YHC4_9EUKA